MYWSDKLALQIIKSEKHKPYWVDDMKTPSGRIHVGALRGVIVHDLLHRSLKKLGMAVTYTWVFNDMDPMDGFPHYLQESFRKFMGYPLFKIPSPQKGFSSLSSCFAQEFIQVFNNLGVKPRIIWSSEWYLKGKFNQVIKEALDKAAKIRVLYQKISGYKKPKDWYPFQVICPQCGKVGTTLVTGWDGEKVSFECRKDLVKWAQGCEYKGKISPYNGTGKLMWKVDWAAHWKVIGITIEGAGKDHMSKGGSHDLSSAICEQVFDYPSPFSFAYEWFLTRGGIKMSSSKGIGLSAWEVSQIMPPELLRFLLVRPNYRKAIIFDPTQNNTILNLFDDYDFCAEQFYEGKGSDFGTFWKLSQIKAVPKNKLFLPRFRDVVNYIQSTSIKIEEKFSEIKGSELTTQEKLILEERIRYAQIWLDKFAPKEMVYQLTKSIPEEAKKLSLEQKKYLMKLIDLISQKSWQPEELQQKMYELTKKLKISPKLAFQAIYLSLIGKTHGPKAAWFILDQGKEVIKRLSEVSK